MPTMTRNKTAEKEEKDDNLKKDEIASHTGMVEGEDGKFSSFSLSNLKLPVKGKPINISKGEQTMT